MDRIIVFHGGEKIIEKPIFGIGDPHSDYGKAFYCAPDLYAAKEWANKKSVGGYANKYQLDARGLKILDLTDKAKYSPLHWFAILMHHRRLDPEFKETYRRELDYLERHYYLDVSQYDVIRGYRADDAYFRFPLLFVRSEIRLELLETIYTLGHLGIQIGIVSEKALGRLKFVEAIPAEPVYKDKYRTRIFAADERFAIIAREERWREGTRLIDLVKKDDPRQ